MQALPAIIFSVLGFLYRVLSPVAGVIATAITIIIRIIGTLLTRGFSIARIGAILAAISRLMPQSVQQRAQVLFNTYLNAALSSARLNGSLNWESYGLYGSQGSYGIASSNFQVTFQVAGKVLNAPFSIKLEQILVRSGLQANDYLGETAKNCALQSTAIGTGISNVFIGPIIAVATEKIKKELLDYCRILAFNAAKKELEALIGKITLAAISGYITQLQNLNADSTTPIDLQAYSEPFKVEIKVDLKATLHAKSDKFLVKLIGYTSNGSSCSGGMCNPPFNQSIANCIETKKKKKWERKSGSTNTTSLDSQDATFYISKISVRRVPGLNPLLASQINSWAASLAGNHSLLINAIRNVDPAANPNPKWTDIPGVLTRINNEFASWLTTLNSPGFINFNAMISSIGGCFYKPEGSTQTASACRYLKPPLQDPYGAMCNWSSFYQSNSADTVEGKALEPVNKTISFNSFNGWIEFNQTIGVPQFSFAAMEPSNQIYPPNIDEGP